MKTKLLKKVKKRFEIVHYPKGVILYNEHYNYNLFQLVDHKESCYNVYYVQLGKSNNELNFVYKCFDTEKECIDYLKSRIIKRLKNEGYKQRKNQIIRNSEKKVWSI